MANRSKPSDKANASARTNGRDSLVKLRAHVDDIEKRLKRANSLTKSSITALTTAYERLHERSVADKNTKRLAHYIDELASQLNGLIEQTRIDVAHDLQVVMSDPRMDTLSAAVTKANKRLTHAESQQADAISAINGQIAKLATAMDDRMQREVRAREKGLAVLDAKINTSHIELAKQQDVFEADLKANCDERAQLQERIASVEHLSAEAVKSIGDKVVDVTQELRQQTEALTKQTQALKHEVGAQGLDLQKGYEEHKEEMARRIEALEDDQRNTIPSLERRLVTMATRIELLESNEYVAPSAIGHAGQNIDAPAPPPFASAETAAADAVTTFAQSTPFGDISEADAINIAQTDAFSANEPTVLTPVAPPTNPYASQEPEEVLDLVAATSETSSTKYVPQEYVPETYVPETYVPETYVPETYVSETYVSKGQVADQYAPEAYVSEQFSVLETPVPVSVPVSGAVATAGGVAQYAPEFPTSSPTPSHAETGAFEPTEFVAASTQPEPAFNQAVDMLETPPPPFASGMPPMPNVQTGAPTAAVDVASLGVASGEMVKPQTMYEARPGAEPEKISRFKSRKKSPKKPRKQKSTSGGNGGGIPAPLRVGGLMMSVAVVGLFAAKTILPKVMGVDPQPSLQAEANPAVGSMSTSMSTSMDMQQASNTLPQSPEQIGVKSVEAVGDYSATMKAPDLGVDIDGKPSAQKLTLEAAAIKGEAVAQFQLGLSHLEAGRTDQAVRLMRLAANQDQAAAQYRLGKLYEAGVGVEANLETAMGLLEKSAAGGNRIAMHDLGHYHATGAASEPNIEKAVDWFEKAAKRGVLDSQFNLGVLYQDGSGVRRDTVAAYAWFAIAGAQGDTDAAQRSTLVARDLSEDQLKTAKARVKAFTPTRINDAANGVFKALPWGPKTAARHINTDDTIKDAQAMLASLGYDVGTPDGAMGPRTRNAVISFERANGLPQTGRVNANLVDRLTLATGA